MNQPAVERLQLGLFGKMNAGKSTLMNLITQQATSLVDATPGTTADTRATLIEIQGLGPVRLFDTAGIDEAGSLGSKKRQRALHALKECDLALLVIDPRTTSFTPEQGLLEAAREVDKQVLVIYNLFTPAATAGIDLIEQELPLLRFYHKLPLQANDPANRTPLLDFILTHFTPERHTTPLLPFIKRDHFYLLNTPLDDAAPAERLIRPQTLALAEITRQWAWPLCHRMDLARARQGDRDEHRRFDSLRQHLGEKLAGIITDSQAMDIMAEWVPATTPLTTFSIMMINHGTAGRLADFARGAAALDRLQAGDRILIAEACNHTRIAEDIGTVQIPAIIARKWPGVVVEHNFGREFQENEELQNYALVIHCGGCMISNQKLQSRIRDLDATSVPYTNYGVFLAYAQGRDALARVLAPWGITL